ncbi:MAG: ATP-dependent 6-phosphofructokinase [Rhodospirillaceae bacterium]|nr:ATP-dependent 6-phosphofructokinase [Rhodospirillaceae bacterium]
MSSRRLAVLTSGGDCAGLNAVIRAVTDHAAGTYGWDVIGIKNGHLGLLEDPPLVVKLTPETVRGNVSRTGGTFLGTTTKGDPFAFPDATGKLHDRSGDVIARLKHLGVNALVVIGGDGSLRLFQRLLNGSGISWVGVPKTIDNDVPGTDYAVGFFTAVEVAGEALDRLSSTAESHRRIMVLEVMGRDSGFISLYGGLAGGADVILMPEIPYDIEAMATHIKKLTDNRPSAVLVVAAEGVKPPPGDRRTDSNVGVAIARELQARTGFDARCTVLGHLQRGGSPAMFDRLLASSFGAKAVDLLHSGQTSRLVVWRGGVVTDIPIADAVAGPCFVPIDGELIRTARALGIYIGDTAR